VEAFEELVQLGFAERSARSVVQHLQRARRDVEDVLLLITHLREDKHAPAEPGRVRR
jgi:Holliday junction resolvasome RuvABC DNA-binding subunit